MSLIDQDDNKGIYYHFPTELQRHGNNHVLLGSNSIANTIGLFEMFLTCAQMYKLDVSQPWR